MFDKIFDNLLVMKSMRLYKGCEAPSSEERNPDEKILKIFIYLFNLSLATGEMLQFSTKYLTQSLCPSEEARWSAVLLS
jgi:hypothetical protein